MFTSLHTTGVEILQELCADIDTAQEMNCLIVISQRFI